MIDIRDLTFSYGGHSPLFEGFNLKVDRGEAWSIIGASGCGKTTLLYLLAGLRRPNAGEIFIDNSPVVRPRPRSGLVLQDHGLLPWATVQENARLGLTIRKFYGSDGRHAPVDEQLNTGTVNQRIDHWLTTLGIEKLRSQYPAMLSRGQRQRTAIARTLSMEPDLLLLDEPFSALDAPTREDLESLIIDLNTNSNLTYIIVTHDIEAAVVMGKKILVLETGTNQSARVIENKSAGSADFRKHDAFHRKYEELREILGSLT